MFDSGEGLEEFDAIGESGMVGVEFADGIEVEAELASPILDMIGAVGGIDDGESGLAGEAKDFHFCLMDFSEGFGAIDDIDDPRSLDDGFEEVAFSGEGIVSVVFGEERAKDFEGILGG